MDGAIPASGSECELSLEKHLGILLAPATVGLRVYGFLVIGDVYGWMEGMS